jgi:hypothetical protein
MNEEGYRPPANPAHPELGPSGYAASAMGPPSRLTDDERSLLTYLALRRVADDLAISDQEAADLLDGYADRGDPCQFVGDQLAVAIVAGGVELFRADRAWLRAVAISGDGAQN